MTTRKNLRSFRISAQAERQLAELSEALGTSLTETISIALDRMYQQECNKETPMNEVKISNDGKTRCPICGTVGTGYGQGLQDPSDKHVWVWENGKLIAAPK